MGPPEKFGRMVKIRDDHGGVQKNMIEREMIRGGKLAVETRKNIFHTCGNFEGVDILKEKLKK